jgi:hypothetical protein
VFHPEYLSLNKTKTITNSKKWAMSEIGNGFEPLLKVDKTPLSRSANQSIGKKRHPATLSLQTKYKCV